MDFDPTKVRVSRHFLLSDFLGCHSVYSRGLPNLLAGDDPELPLKWKNAKALCNEFLEPFLEQAGPLSISYGYISPEVSRAIVHYQDPDKPSHHMWNLGAACDIISHEWVNNDPEDDTEQTAPISLAHAIHRNEYPYSRLISYAESPYLCVAVSAKEVQAHNPRLAFYENRFVGTTKPEYKSYSSSGAKDSAAAALDANGLPHGWRGRGYPSYHGGGRRQLHHIRTSDYTMLSDFLFDLQSIANGEKNVPNVRDQDLMAMFYAAGDVVDLAIRETGINHFSITKAFVSHSNPYFEDSNDWYSGEGSLILVPPEGVSAAKVQENILVKAMFGGSPIKTCVVGDDNDIIIRFTA